MSASNYELILLDVGLYLVRLHRLSHSGKLVSETVEKAGACKVLDAF